LEDTTSEVRSLNNSRTDITETEFVSHTADAEVSHTITVQSGTVAGTILEDATSEVRTLDSEDVVADSSIHTDTTTHEYQTYAQLDDRSHTLVSQSHSEVTTRTEFHGTAVVTEGSETVFHGGTVPAGVGDDDVSGVTDGDAFDGGDGNGDDDGDGGDDDGDGGSAGSGEGVTSTTEDVSVTVVSNSDVTVTETESYVVDTDVTRTVSSTESDVDTGASSWWKTGPGVSFTEDGERTTSGVDIVTTTTTITTSSHTIDDVSGTSSWWKTGPGVSTNPPPDTNDAEGDRNDVSSDVDLVVTSAEHRGLGRGALRRDSEGDEFDAWATSRFQSVLKVSLWAALV
jgi:hypothetical protein